MWQEKKWETRNNFKKIDSISLFIETFYSLAWLSCLLSEHQWCCLYDQMIPDKSPTIHLAFLGHIISITQHFNITKSVIKLILCQCSCWPLKSSEHFPILSLTLTDNNNENFPYIMYISIYCIQLSWRSSKVQAICQKKAIMQWSGLEGTWTPPLSCLWSSCLIRVYKYLS